MHLKLGVYGMIARQLVRVFVLPVKDIFFVLPGLICEFSKVLHRFNHLLVSWRGKKESKITKHKNDATCVVHEGL